MKTKAILTGMAGLALTACGTATEEKPNIVIILADDLGYGDISLHGSRIQTPNIDRIASEGIELCRHYAAPVSSPTRAGLMTGRYPSRFGIRETVIPPWREYGLPEGEETIADVLGRNGYENRAMIGKWHLGHGRLAYYPLNRGFTHFYGCLNGALDYFTHERDGELDWHDDWDSCYDKGYTTDLIADEAVECIREYSEDGPYFLYVAFNAPHSPYMAPEDEIAEHIPLDEFNALEKKKDRNGWTYRAMVSRMDKGIGRILDALEESGQIDNTVILFMSDNGGVPGMEPYSTNKPLRGAKFQEFEGGVRVSGAMYWEKGFMQGGRKIDEVTSFVDILPTLADIIGAEGAPKNPYDGVSIYPLLKGEAETMDRTLYLGVGAAVSRDWKMILAGRNPGLGLEKDFFVDMRSNPYEKGNDMEGHESIAEEMKPFIIQYDTITPIQKELPYGYGKKGFKAPKEWKVTKP